MITDEYRDRNPAYTTDKSVVKYKYNVFPLEVKGDGVE